MIKSMLLVAIGSALGAVLRYGAGLAFVFPFGTLAVNLAGGLGAGILFVALGGRLTSALEASFIIGFLGGMTTFSSFSIDVFRLFEEGRLAFAALYILVSVFGAIFACFLGAYTMRSIL